MATNIIEIRNQLLGGGGNQSPAANMLEGGSSQAAKDRPASKRDQEGVFKKFFGKTGIGKITKILGVTFGVSTLLKQSQIFTSMFGTVFQIIGAMADIILAPVFKVLAPKLGEFAEKAVQYANNFAGKLEAVLNWLWSDKEGAKALFASANLIKDQIIHGQLGFFIKMTKGEYNSEVEFLGTFGKKKLTDWWNTSWQSIKDFFKPMIDWIKKTMGMADTISSAPGDLLQKAKDVGNSIANIVKSNTQAANNVVNTNMTTLGNIAGFQEGGQTEMFNERMTTSGFLHASLSSKLLEDYALNEHTKHDFDDMLKSRRNNVRGMGGAGHADM